MNKFDETYNEITSRIFYQSIHTLNHNYKEIKQIESKTAKQFYNSLIIIKDDEDKIILEAHQDAEFNKALINKIFNANNFTQLQANQVFERCSKSIKENYSIKVNVPLYIFNFSFSNQSKFIADIFRSFKIKFSLQSGTLQQKVKYEGKIFKQYFSNTSGFFSIQKTCCFVILNTDMKTQTTVIHQIYHYLQYILEKDQNKHIIKSQFFDIPQLQLSMEDQEYLFDKYEFETHIKVDLINQLEQFYFKYYKDKLSKRQFIEKFILAIEKDPKNAVNNFVNLLRNSEKHSDAISLRLFAACFLVKNKQYLIEAQKWLKERFKF